MSTKEGGTALETREKRKEKKFTESPHNATIFDAADPADPADAADAAVDKVTATSIEETTAEEQKTTEKKTKEQKTEKVQIEQNKSEETTTKEKKPMSKLEQMRAKRLKAREDKKRKLEKEREARARAAAQPVTMASRKAAQKKAAAVRNAKKAEKLLAASRKDISDVLLYTRFAGYIWTCSRRGSHDFGKWHRRYLELHYKEARFLVKRGGTSAVPRSFPLLKGTKIKSMKKVKNLPGKENESFPSFELLIGGTSQRHWIAVPSTASLESWMHAFREFVPSVMSILRSTRMPSKTETEMEAQREHERQEDVRTDELKKKIKALFKVAKPTHGGILMKQEFIFGMDAVKKNSSALKKIKRDPVLKILLEPRLWLQSLMDLDTHKENYVSFDEVLHFVRLIETRTIKRKRALEKLFEAIDTDHNGELDSEEMMNAMRDNPNVLKMVENEEALRPLLNPATYSGAFAAMDLNKDGVVSMDEILTFCDHFEERAATRMHNLRLFFKLVDVDHDGELTKEEVLEALNTDPEVRKLVSEEPSLVPLLSPSHYKEAFKMMDTDGDGTITLEELFIFCGVREDKLTSSLHMWRTLFDAAVNMEQERTTRDPGDMSKLRMTDDGMKPMITLRMLSMVIMHSKQAAKTACQSSIMCHLLKPSTYHKGAAQFNHYAHLYHHEPDDDDDNVYNEEEEDAKNNIRDPTLRIKKLKRQGIKPGTHVKTWKGEFGVLRFVGVPQGFDFISVGIMCGVELDKPHGTGDGIFRSKGDTTRCFVCLPKHGIFLDPARLEVIDRGNQKEEIDVPLPPALPLFGFIDFCEELSSHEEDEHTVFINGEEVTNNAGPETDDNKKNSTDVPEWHAHVHKNKWKGHAGTMKQLFDLHDPDAALHKQYLYDKRKEHLLFLARARRKREAEIALEMEKEDAERVAGGGEVHVVEEEKSEDQIKKDAAIRAREEELQKLLHKAHDHMLLRVPAVKGNELYCVECRRIQIEYTKQIRQNEEDDRREKFDVWLNNAEAMKKEDDEQWASEEEERQRSEDRRHGRFKEWCKRDLRRFEIRKKNKNKSEEFIIRAIRSTEPNLFTGKKKKKKKKKKVEDAGEKTEEGSETETETEGKETKGEPNNPSTVTVPVTVPVVQPPPKSLGPVDWWVTKIDDYGLSDVNPGGPPGEQLLDWSSMEQRLNSKIDKAKLTFDKEWVEVSANRTQRFQEEKVQSVARQREQENAITNEETVRKIYDDETERQRQAERDIRPSENKVLRREQGNRQIYISTVGQMRTRTRLGRMLWQKTLRADGQTHTHQVYDAARQKSYIIKFIPAANESEVATIMDDVYLIKRVASDCPYLVDVDDCFYHSVTGLGGGYYIVVCIFECCIGGEARQAIVDAEHGLRPIVHDGELLAWTKQAALAIGSLHDHQFVHRNLKPENIFLTTEDMNANVKVGDYPITKTFEATLPEASTYVGAPRYLAPELLQQDFFPGVIAPPLDIWALGCCVYYLASGKEICLREDGSFPKPLEDMLLAIPARFGTPLKDIIRSCLSLHPEERPSARQIAHVANEELVHQENERQARARNAKAIIDLFELIDEDQSGAIELDELLTATTHNRKVIRLLKKSERLRPLLQPEKVRPFFVKMDANGDGELTLDEMLQFCQTLHHEPTYEKELLNQMVQLFNLIDRDHKLYIGKEELLEAITYRPDVIMIMEVHPKLSLLLKPGSFEETFLSLDSHHTGHVTLDELMEFVVSNHEQEEIRQQERELQKAKERAWRQVDRERRKR